ncbi:MAG: sugar phosphate nucleotidyltransferase, partial [Patescibacteria group bacterium]
THAISRFEKGAKIFVKKVSDPHRFGVVEMDERGRVLGLEEKPEAPKSSYAQTGFYLYDERAVNFAKSLRPSERGELEIVDLNNIYLTSGELQAEVVEGEWIDAGTFESLHQASVIVREHELGIKDGRSNLEVKIKRPISSKKEALI